MSCHDKNVEIFLNLLSKSTPFGYSRFNDGEMGGIHRVGFVAARGDQRVDESLQENLKSSLQHKQENYWVGIPCSRCYPEYHNLAKQLVGDYEYITSAVALTNRNWKYWIDNCSAVLEGKSILWIGGDDQNTDNLRKIGISVGKTVRYSRRETWSQFDLIDTACYQLSSQYDITFISLGPTARVLACKWFKNDPNTTKIDIGSVFDPFTRNVYHNCHTGWETGFNKVKRCLECN